MSHRSQKHRTESRALLRSARGECLIIRRAGGAADAAWEFPGGPVERSERPADALHRHCHEQVGVAVEIVAAPPPIARGRGAHVVSTCFFVCSIADGVPHAAGGLESRWILPAQLREYYFDSPAQQIVDWLLTGDGSA